MNTLRLVIIGITIGIGLILIGVLVAVTLKRKGGESKGIDYRAFYILGISFLPLGIIYEIVFFVSGTKIFLILGFAFVGIGFSYLAIGLGNRDKWKKQ